MHIIEFKSEKIKFVNEKFVVTSQCAKHFVISS